MSLQPDDVARAKCPACRRYYGMSMQALIDRGAEHDFTCGDCRAGRDQQLELPSEGAA